LAFPEDRCAWSFEEQYMFGPSLLVAPVLQPGGKVHVYLPKGTWYDFWTKEKVEGGQVLELTMPLDKIPIYGAEGAFVPLGPAVQHTGELPPGCQVDEVMYFGKPTMHLDLPGMTLPS
jgi:alpha-D-xyloside xylohydrolase